MTDTLAPSTADPLADPSLREPGIWQSLREGLFGERRPLDCLQVEVTSLCPGRCTYCPHTTDAAIWKSRHMEASTFARLWPLMRQCTRVHLQGWGEPFLHPRFMDFAALARRAGCRVSTTTCGLVMHEALAEQLVNSGIDVIAFSLAGTSQATNACRRGVDFERVCEAIRLLQRVRKQKMGVHLEIHLAYLMLASSIEAASALPALMDALDVHAAVVSTLDYISTPELAAEALSPKNLARLAQARAVLETVRDAATAAGRNLHYALPSATPAPPSAGQNKHGTATVDCRENIARTLYVDAEGALSPCIYLNLPTTDTNPLRRVFGSAQRENPLEIWHGEPFQKFRKALADQNPDPACLQCVKRLER